MNIYYQIIIIQESRRNKKQFVWETSWSKDHEMSLKVTIKLSINYFLIIDLYLKCVGSNIIGKQGYTLKFVLME